MTFRYLEESCNIMKKRIISAFLITISLSMLVQVIHVFADDNADTDQIITTEETINTEEATGSEETDLNSEENEVNRDAFILVSNTFDTIQVGDVAEFDVTFNLNGRDTAYKNVVLTITLPQNIDGENVIFDSSSDLSIKGIVPNYDSLNHILTYNFDELLGGFDMVKTYQLKTRNGMNPDNNNLQVVATLESDDLAQTLSSDSTITLNAIKNVSLSNKFSHNENAFIKNVIRYLDTVYFDVSASVNRYSRGSMDIDADRPVIIEYQIPDGMQYISNDSGYEPEIDGNTLRWVLPSHLNDDDSYYFIFNAQIKFKVISELPLFKFVETTASISVPFINGEQLEEEKISRTMVSPNDEQDEIHTVGSGYPTFLRGPSNDKGGVGGTANLDINVTDGALLGWVISTYANTATSPDSGFNAYDLFYHQDPNLILEQFYSGDYYFKPNANYSDFEPLTADIFYSLSVRYTDSDEWVPLKADIRPSTYYSADEIGIDKSRTVETLWMHFHDNKSDDNIFVDHVGRHKYFDESYFSIPAGLCSPNIWFYTKVNDEYIGRVENKIGVAYSGWNTNNNRSDYRSEYVPSELITDPDMRMLPASWLAYTKPKSANIVRPPEGINRYIKSSVALVGAKNNIVEPGVYNLKLALENDESSLRSFNGPFESYLILPEGMSIADLNSNPKAQITVIDDNYQQKNETLIKIVIQENSIRIGGISSVTVPVRISETASYKQNIRFLGYLNQEFNVATTSNAYGYYTKKIPDHMDLNQNNNVDEYVYFTENAYTFKSAYDYYATSNFNFDNISKNKANYDLMLNVYNEKNNRINDFVLVETLPTKDDFKILEDLPRNSEYDVMLTSALELTHQQEELFDVYYSQSIKPPITGIIDAHIGEKYPKFKLPTAEGDAEWIAAEDVEDFSEIKSILITLKQNKSFTDNIQSFKLNVSSDLIKKDVEAKTSYNTFAFAINDILPLETVSTPVAQINRDQLISVDRQELEYVVNSVVSLDQFYEDLGLKIFADTEVTSTYSAIDFTTVGDYQVVVRAVYGDEEEIIDVIVHIIPAPSDSVDQQHPQENDVKLESDNVTNEHTIPNTSAEQTYALYVMIMGISLIVMLNHKKKKKYHH